MRSPTLPALILAMAASPAAQADGWNWFPVADADYEANATVSALGGVMDPDVGSVDAGGAYGVELSLQCPTLAPPTGRIRQQISITGFDNDGLELLNVEINPHYLIDVGNNLAVGFGPGLGYVDAETGRNSDGVFALQAGVSLHYRQGPLFLGAEARYQWTQEADFGRRDEDLNNARLLGKVGLNF